MTTATATTPPQMNDLIAGMRENNRAAGAARFLVQFLTQSAKCDVKFSFLRFCRQRELAAVNLSFFAFT